MKKYYKARANLADQLGVTYYNYYFYILILAGLITYYKKNISPAFTTFGDYYKEKINLISLNAKSDYGKNKLKIAYTFAGYGRRYIRDLNNKNIDNNGRGIDILEKLYARSYDRLGRKRSVECVYLHRNFSSMINHSIRVLYDDNKDKPEITKHLNSMMNYIFHTNYDQLYHSSFDVSVFDYHNNTQLNRNKDYYNFVCVLLGFHYSYVISTNDKLSTERPIYNIAEYLKEIL